MSTTALALVASAVFLVRLVPQPARLARSGVDAGVSPLAALNAVIGTVAWLVYGLDAGLPVVWIVSLLALVPGVWTVALLRSATTARDLTWAAAWVAVLAAAATAGVFGLALAAGVVVSSGPQVVAAVRSEQLSGLAPATWWLAIADAVTWGAYGLALGDAALTGYGVVLLASALIVLSRIRVTSASVALAG